MKREQQSRSMERLRFKYSITNLLGMALYIAVAVGVGYLILLISLGDYIIAWYITMVSSMTILHILTIPRYILLSQNAIEIRCLLKVVTIDSSSIEKIEKVSPRELHFAIPLSLWFGFWGSVGLFFIPKKFKLARFYITESRYLLKIKTLSGRLYYISCRERDSIINTIEPLPPKKV